MPEWITMIASLIAGLLGGGGLVRLFQLRSENAKTDADANKVAADTDKVAGEAWALLVQQMSTSLTATQVRVTLLETILKERDIQQRSDSKRIEELERQIVALNDTLAKRDALITELRAELDALKTRIMGEKK